ncbi:MAG: Fic family protein [Pseudomonadota bacterium]
MISDEYIWQQPDWPHWQYDLTALTEPLMQVCHARGYWLGRLQTIGFDLRQQTTLQAVTADVVKTSEIEGERLNQSTVRSSIARRLGVDIGALAPADRHVDGVVEMMLDAVRNSQQPLTAERLFGWHAALFPSQFSGLNRVRVGAWRDDAAGPMQIVSGPIGRERVHYQAPPAARIATEMDAFLYWFNQDQPVDPIIRAAIAHLWFVTIHPFDDGNGRIARAISDLMLSRAESSPHKFYSLSAQIQCERDTYYQLLEQTQRGSLVITAWLDWFIGCLQRALNHADDIVSAVLNKARFWQQWSGCALNPRQIRVLNRLLDGFAGKLTSRKWARLAKCSTDTALRDITALVQRGILCRSTAGGRSTSYDLVSF